MRSPARWVAVLVTALWACGDDGALSRSRRLDESMSATDAGEARDAQREIDAGETSDFPPQAAEALDNEVGVVPVFFVPSGAELTDADYRQYNRRVLTHLRITQKFYLSQLKTETFRIEDKSLVYRSPNAVEHYRDPMRDPDPDDTLGALKVRELLESLHEDRFSSRRVFVILFVRPKGQPSGNLGFGRPFSGGPPVRGGGVVELELSDLVNHDTSPFQSTLAHELGHAFGLAHVDCHGYDMDTNDSITSYNLAHHSHGSSESATPGILIPENFFVLAQNKGVFPGFDYAAAVHDPQGAPLQNIEQCYMTPMSAGLGEAPPASPQGYRLSYDGQVVSGPETAYWVFARAKDNCRDMVQSSPTTQVTCSFNGVPFDPLATP